MIKLILFGILKGIGILLLVLLVQLIQLIGDRLVVKSDKRRR